MQTSNQALQMKQNIYFVYTTLQEGLFGEILPPLRGSSKLTILHYWHLIMLRELCKDYKVNVETLSAGVYVGVNNEFCDPSNRHSEWVSKKATGHSPDNSHQDDAPDNTPHKKVLNCRDSFSRGRYREGNCQDRISVRELFGILWNHGFNWTKYFFFACTRKCVVFRSEIVCGGLLRTLRHTLRCKNVKVNLSILQK